MIVSVSGKIGSGKDLVGSIIQYLIDSDRFNYKISEQNYNDYLKNKHDLKSYWKIVKWADKLKDIVCILLSCTREQLEDRVFKETELGEEWWYYKCGNLFDGYELHNYKNESYEDLSYIYNKSNVELIKPTPRLLMQLLGTECGRNILHPNVWVNATMVDYKCIGNIPDSNAKHIQIDETHSKYDNYNNEVYPNWIITDTRFPNEADAVKSRGGINIRLQRNNDLDNNDTHISETALDFYKFDYVVDNNGTIEDLIIKVKEILIKEQII